MKKIINRIVEQQNFEYVLFGSIPLIIKDKLTNNINISSLINSVESAIPRPPAGLIKSIIVGYNPIFDKRKVNALYYNGIIYLSNDQDDLNDMLDDIVHEYSHALEEVYGNQIYSDGAIKDEFSSKRFQLERILKSNDYQTYEFDFSNDSYNKELDNFLLNVVGYERFEKLTNYGLFVNPYAAVSLREYFATGFEEYILGDHQELKNISPNLYNKLRELF